MRENQTSNETKNEIVVLDLGIDEEEMRDRERKQRIAKRRKREKRKDQFKRFLMLLCVGAAILLAYDKITNVYQGRSIITENAEEITLTRDIEYHLDKFDEPPTGRIYAWKSELPKMVLEDFKQVTCSKDRKMLYTCKGNDIVFRNWDIYEEKEWIVEINDETLMYSATEISMYATDEELVIYANSYEGFTKVTLNFETSEVKTDVVTMHTEIPITENVSDYIWVKDYLLCLEGENVLFLCKDGNIIGDKITIKNDKVESLYSEMVYTEKKVLYKPYVSEEGLLLQEVTKIDLSKDKMVKFNSPYMSFEYAYQVGNNKVKLQIFMDEDDRYPRVLVPNSLDYYKAYCESEDGYWNKYRDNGWHFENLKDNFLKAEITSDFDYSPIYAEVYFKVENDLFSYSYRLYGFDTDVSIPEGELSESYTVFSEDEFWETVETIRDVFEKYYDKAPAE